jgi:hypothetical protein
MHSIVVNAAKSKLRQQWAQPFMASLDEPLSGQEHFHIADKVADPHSNLDEEYDLKEKNAFWKRPSRGCPRHCELSSACMTLKDCECAKLQPG